MPLTTMNPKTPQVDDGCSNAVPDAPVPPSRHFTRRKNKSGKELGLGGSTHSR